MEDFPICYVKPTILCIDDDVNLTDTLKKTLGKHYSIVCFNKHNELLDYIKEYKSIFDQNKLFREFTESEYSDQQTSLLVQVNLKNINDLITHTSTSKEIGVVIVDNHMPDIDGVTLCKSLKYLPFKRVLYTGTNDYKAGIEAMNKGLIDSFISKDSSLNELTNRIDEFIFKYFNERTSSLKQYLEIDESLPLSDKLFYNYFLKLIKDNNIEKYCIYDKNGSINMMDKVGNKSLLLVHTDKSLEQFLKFTMEEKEFNHIHNQVVNREKIPLIDYNKSGIDLEDIKLYTPDIIIGKMNYYITYLNF